MLDTKKEDRRAAIETAAYALLLERGYAGTSMLQIAKRAKASNETLYKWYGDKLGLFAAMVERNAAAGMEHLALPLGADQSFADKLTGFGTALLMGILSDRAVALNRVAAADTSGALGATLAKHGRAAVVPLLDAVWDDMPLPAPLPPHLTTARQITETYLALLIADLQARRIIGQMAAPNRDFCATRARQAATLIQTLIRPDTAPPRDLPSQRRNH